MDGCAKGLGHLLFRAQIEAEIRIDIVSIELHKQRNYY